MTFNSGDSNRDGDSLSLCVLRLTAALVGKLTREEWVARFGNDDMFDV